MTLLLIPVPFIFGYLLTARVLKERQWQLRLAVAYALALTLFLFVVNALFHFLSLRLAVYTTVALMAVGSLGLLRLRPVVSSPVVLGRLEATVVIVLAMTAAFRALFFQMMWVDDDLFPHGPLMALYLQDIFPPRNPLHPELPYLGHYGRDLTISALSVLLRERFFMVQYVVTALNQGVIVMLIYFVSRRFLRSGRQALMTVILAFLGGWALMEVFGNNNSFVYLFLFLNSYLCWIALIRRDVGSKVVATVGLATYSIVYETHYGILLIVFAIFPILLMLQRRRWGMRYVTIPAIIGGASLAIALVHGGTLTDIGRRLLSYSSHHASTVETQSFFTQEVRLRFPKPRFMITSFDGSDYPVISARLLREAGAFVLFLPLATAIMLYRQRYWGLWIAAMGLVAVLVPATVEFGAQNVESYRFLFFGGVAAAMTCGIAVGMWLDWIAPRGPLPSWAKAVVLVFLVVSCGTAIRRTTDNFRDVLRRPSEYYWRAEDWACHGAYSARLCDPADARAAMRLRPLVKAGESLMLNTSNVAAASYHTDAMLAALSGTFIRGRGVRVSSGSGYKMGMDFEEPSGFRAIAFWSTGDVTLLDELGADYLLVDPAKLLPRAYERLAREGRLKLLFREAGLRPGAIREVYRVEQGLRESAPPVPSDLRVEIGPVPSGLEPATFYEVPFSVTTRDSSFEGKIKVGYRVFRGGRLMNWNDEIRHVVNLERGGREKWTGYLHFVAPYEAGRYDVTLQTFHETSVQDKATFTVDIVATRDGSRR
jgi:hypothetical protein